MSYVPEVEIDRENGTTYIQLSENHVVRTQRIEVLVDVDELGRAIGIELLNLVPSV